MLRFCFEPLSPDVLFSKEFVQGLTLRTLIFDNFYVLLSIQIDFTFLLVIFSLIINFFPQKCQYGKDFKTFYPTLS